MIQNDGKYQYEVRAGHAHILRYIGTEQLVNVPARLGGSPVWGIAVAAFRGNKYVAEVTLSQGIKTVGEEAFADCKQLISVVFPNSLVYVGRACFDGCGWLTNLTLPFFGLSRDAAGDLATLAALFGNREFISGAKQRLEALDDTVCLPRITTLSVTDQKDIPARAAMGWRHIESLSIPRAVNVGENAFDGCTALCDLQFGDCLANIGKTAFKNCPIVEFVAPPSLRAIGDNAFYGCSHLAKLELNRGLNSIGSRAFYGCGVVNVRLPSTVATFGEYCFAKCKSLAQASFEVTYRYSPLPAHMFDGAGLKTLGISIACTFMSRAFLRGVSPKELLLFDAEPRAVHLEAFMEMCPSIDRIFVPDNSLSAYVTFFPQYEDMFRVSATGDVPLLDVEVDEFAPLLDDFPGNKTGTNAKK